MSSIDFTGVTKSFKTRTGPVTAVRDLTLSITQGSLLVLVGPSGCGKTTTLRLLAGLDLPTAGTIFLGGRDVTRVSPRDRDVAMVFQNYALYPHMTVGENLGFGLKMRGTPRRQRLVRVREVADALGIAQLLTRKPATLSGGEQQRVAIGRAIARHPAVFLFDEPLANLDASLRRQMRSEIKQLHRQIGVTTIYVTHDQEEALSLGDQVAVLRDGVLQQVAAPNELYVRPGNQFVAEFMGAPRMNLIPAQVDGRNGSWRFRSDVGTFPIPIGTRDPVPPIVVLGIRPQHITLIPRLAINPPGPSGDPENQARGSGVLWPGLTVTQVEPLGDVQDVHLRSPGGTTVVARCPMESLLATNDQVDAMISASRFHVFSSTDGRRLN